MIVDIEGVLAALNESGVRYLVVGGVAVVLHGYLRTTADLDLVIDLSNENAAVAVRTLASLGYRPRAHVSLDEFALDTARQRWRVEKNMEVFSLWHPSKPGFEIDLFVTEPFEFSDAYERAARLRLRSTEATVAAIDDLISMKKRAGRPRDLEDIAALEGLRSNDEREG